MQISKYFISTIFGLFLVLPVYSSSAAEDTRQMVDFPKMMQEHMLSNMRDHLRALEEILGALAAGDTETAIKTAENRIGMSSLEDHGAAHLAKFMPEGMKAAGTEMHHASSRFVIALQNAEIKDNADSQKEVYGALNEIFQACNACHSTYKVR
jgi:cytochrome c556